MPEISKEYVRKKIESFFAQTRITPDETRKIRNLAMHYKIRLGKHRARFCKKCCADLKTSKIRVTKNYKTKQCPICKYVNRIKIS
jgi:hypothetical protein